MHKLLSLPPNAVKDYNQLHNRNRDEWFCASDPIDKRLGSGSGTTWLLEECFSEECFNENSTHQENSNVANPNEDNHVNIFPVNSASEYNVSQNISPQQNFLNWLSQEKRILIHAGGQSRRLPAYAVTGKISLPVPVFRWARGQRLSQDLLSLQIPLYEKIIKQAPESLHTLIVSGDVYIHASESLQEIPEADVVCYGLWVDSSLATRHGVFAAKRDTPDVLDMMLQKPSLDTLEGLSQSHFVLMDIGVWLLSDRAVELLRNRSYNSDGELQFYDLYSNFGLALGTNPSVLDNDINGLTVKILPLQGGEFYHYGTSREMISSTLALQNRVYDQRLIMHRKIKPNPAIFTQNAKVNIKFNEGHRNIWIENSHIGSDWQLHQDHVITGVPDNQWNISLPTGVCIDIVPVGEHGFAIRPYGIDDIFKGDINSPKTLWMGKPVSEWLKDRGVDLSIVGSPETDLQNCKIFPYVESIADLEKVLLWMIGENERNAEVKHDVDINAEVAAKHQVNNNIKREAEVNVKPSNEINLEPKSIWLNSNRFSADELMDVANLSRLYSQRSQLRKMNYSLLEDNYEKSVFYQLDLTDVANDYIAMGLPAPEALPDDADKMQRIHNSMLRSTIFSLQAKKSNQSGLTNLTEVEEQNAFSLLRNAMINSMANKMHSPRMDAFPDQIVWGRSPVRIDLAGGVDRYSAFLSLFGWQCG